MVDLKNFLDVDKLKSLFGKKPSRASAKEDRTENIKNDEDKVEEEIAAIEDEEASEKDSKPKDQKKMIIRAVIILAIAYLIVDQLFLTNPPEKTPETTVPPIAKKNKNPIPETATPTEVVAEPTPVSEATPAAQATLVSENPENSAVKEVPIAPTPLPEATMVPEVTPAPLPTIEATPISQETPEVKVELKPELNSGIGEDVKKNKKDDLGTKLNEMAEAEVPPVSKKLEVKEYVAPPSYENRGRGLIYNCKGKHWACVDKESYLICRKNEIWQRSINKLPECSARNVYSSIDDCKIVQTHNINTAVKTDFCQ